MEDFCWRCGTPLIFLLNSNNILSSECKKCGQGYGKLKGKSLIESRLDSSFSHPLYHIIFEKEKVSQEKVNRIALAFAQHDKRYLEIFIKDIEDELTTPKRKLSDFHNLYGTEEIARDYLCRLSKEIKYLLEQKIK
ncbi:hypothetical protein [Tenacibaculum ascidiaceicola]|uniref:hypothetical protein n=1 Tax=Tenacibaculum ascidiaceicola TaxID=1699411 RepID=UPI0039E68BE8